MSITRDWNLTKITLGELTVWYSYETLVAFEDQEGLFVHQNDWGAATGKHLNSIDQGGKYQSKRLDRIAFTSEYNAMIERHKLWNWQWEKVEA